MATHTSSSHWSCTYRVSSESRDRLWSVLALHLEDDVIVEIHPSIVSQRLVSKEDDSWLFQRKIRDSGRTFNLLTKVTTRPPEMYRWEIIESDGGVAAGSYVENHYEETNRGTSIDTTIRMSLRGVPGFLQKWIIERRMDQADEEDFRYLKKMDTRRR
jgi:hypothetical protein